jgi:hypothetical protein
MTKTQQLRQLMQQHQLKARDVARILNRSVATVEIWRCTGRSVDRIEIPNDALELLKARLAGFLPEGPFDDLPADQRRARLLAQGGEVIG